MTNGKKTNRERIDSKASYTRQIYLEIDNA